MTSFQGVNNNQKQVILDKISEIVDRFKIKSILDIGAGEPSLALPISKLVENYVGIENNPDRVNRLRNEGLKVINGEFPNINILEKFDLVFSCHSIPEDILEYNNFFKKAWSLVKEDGWLIVITFKGVKDNLDDLVNNLRKEYTNNDTLMYDEAINILSSFGEVKREIITSLSSSTDIEKMLDLLSFSIGGSDSEKLMYREKLKNILNNNYKISSRFDFPHNHYVLMVKK